MRNDDDTVMPPIPERPDPCDESDLAKIHAFFRKHRLLVLLDGDYSVDGEYVEQIRAAFPDADAPVSTAEIPRTRVTVFGLELLAFEKERLTGYGEDGKAVIYVGPAPVVRLPNGEAIYLHNSSDMAELRAALEAISKDKASPQEVGNEVPEVANENL